MAGKLYQHYTDKPQSEAIIYRLLNKILNMLYTEADTIPAL